MLRRVLCWTVLVSIAVAIGAGPASAADEVGLSLDGQTWTDELRRPLFDPALRWVPGDTEQRSFWVRNQGPSRASMRIRVETKDPGGLLRRDDIRIDARVSGGSWTPLPDAGGAQPLTDQTLAMGDRVRVDLRVAFVAESTNPSELRELPLRFVVRLTQAGPGGGKDDDDNSGFLPDTGAAVERWLLWVAAGLIGSGLALLLARRRREEQPWVGTKDPSAASAAGSAMAEPAPCSRWASWQRSRSRRRRRTGRTRAP